MNKLNQAFKKMLTVLGVAMLLASVVPSSAFAIGNIPKDNGALRHSDLSFVGAHYCRVEASTTAVLCASGSGMLYAVCAFGTGSVPGPAASSGAMAFDTAVAATITSFQITSRGISPLVYGTSTIAGNTLNNERNLCWQPPVPLRFGSGFVLKTNSVDVNALGLYRLDTGAFTP